MAKFFSNGKSFFARKRESRLQANKRAAKKPLKPTGQLSAKRAKRLKMRLLSLLKEKSPHSYAHSLKVEAWAVRIARELKKSNKNLNIGAVSDAALLHDIGKITVNQSHLNGKEKMSPAQLAVLKKQHVLATHDILSGKFSKEIVEGALSHHERFDGAGYPNALEGARIPLIGRILNVADEFQTKIEERPFEKRTVSVKQTAQELERGKNHSFDPEVVNAFVKVLNRKGLLG